MNRSQPIQRLESMLSDTADEGERIKIHAIIDAIILAGMKQKMLKHRILKTRTPFKPCSVQISSKK